jgi:signal transduction histidine kinase
VTRVTVRRYRPPGLVIWWRRRSLRARLTLTAAAGLAVALAAVAILLISVLGVTLDRGLDNSARQTAREVAALVDANRLPNPVPVAAGTAVVQVIDAQGRIVAASAGADRLVPLLPMPRAEAAARTQTGVPLDGRPYGLPESLRVAAVPGRRGEIVIAAVSYDAVNDTLVTVAHALLLGTPALLLLMVWVSWLITGSTLRPITALRRGAEQVTATGVPRGLPVPEAHDEVHSLAVTLNDMLSRLEAAQQRQRRFVSDTAHELRSPIASIRAQLEVALDHPGSQEWEQTARDVLADTMRLSRLAEDLLALARLEERGGRARGADRDAPGSGASGALPGPDGGEPDAVGAGPGADGPGAGGPVELADLVTGTASRYGQARVPVSASAPEPCPVAGDGEALRRMLVNLIDNAVRYAGNQVTVAARPVDGSVLLTVTDDGPGIAASDTERAFERFTTLDGARARRDGDVSGAGLGLAIVRATARAHGGAVWLEDARPGLRATVRLPLAGPPPHPAGPVNGSPAEPPAERPAEPPAIAPTERLA